MVVVMVVMFVVLRAHRRRRLLLFGYDDLRRVVSHGIAEVAVGRVAIVAGGLGTAVIVAGIVTGRSVIGSATVLVAVVIGRTRPVARLLLARVMIAEDTGTEVGIPQVGAAPNTAEPAGVGMMAIVAATAAPAASPGAASEEAATAATTAAGSCVRLRRVEASHEGEARREGSRSVGSGLGACFRVVYAFARIASAALCVHVLHKLAKEVMATGIIGIPGHGYEGD